MSYGRWIFAKSDGVRFIKAENNEILMHDESFYPECPDSDDVWRLMAAAPELLEALDALLGLGRKATYNAKYDGYYKTAEIAIKKALGK